MIDRIRAVSASEDDLAQRRVLMFATLGFNELVRTLLGMEASFRALRAWLNSWRGIGDIEAGMRRQGYDLYLCRYDGRGWRATFSKVPLESTRALCGGVASRCAAARRRAVRPAAGLV